MPPKRNQNRAKSRGKNNKEAVESAMGDCILPPDLMLCILSRLTVNSLVRFKSVCKPWLKLVSTREIVLWNPATNMLKYLPPSKAVFGAVESVSLGFGCNFADAGGGYDYKVVRILGVKGKKMRSAVEVGVQVHIPGVERASGGDCVLEEGRWVGEVDRYVGVRR